jgi:hypothetical protein
MNACQGSMTRRDLSGRPRLEGVGVSPLPPAQIRVGVRAQAVRAQVEIVTKNLKSVYRI